MHSIDPTKLMLCIFTLEPLFSLSAKDLNLLPTGNDSSQSTSSGNTLKVKS